MYKELVRILNQSALRHNINKIVGVSLGAISIQLCFSTRVSAGPERVAAYSTENV